MNIKQGGGLLFVIDSGLAKLDGNCTVASLGMGVLAFLTRTDRAVYVQILS